MGLIRFLLMLYVTLSLTGARPDHAKFDGNYPSSHPSAAMEAAKPDILIATKAIVSDQSHPIKLFPAILLWLAAGLLLLTPRFRLLRSHFAETFSIRRSARYYYRFSGLSPPVLAAA